jgi:hemerythrin-like domain-containing protein
MKLGYARIGAAFQAPSNRSISDAAANKRQAFERYALPMIKLHDLRCEHEAALDMAQRLLELIDAYQPGQPGFSILMQLNRLYGLLRIHLAHEDVELYPRLIASADPKVARTVQLYLGEISGLADHMESFARHWSCSASITSNFVEFRDAAHDLVLSLVVRIEREERHLYPLAETHFAQLRCDAA